MVGGGGGCWHPHVGVGAITPDVALIAVAYCRVLPRCSKGGEAASARCIDPRQEGALGRERDEGQ